MAAGQRVECLSQCKGNTLPRRAGLRCVGPMDKVAVAFWGAYFGTVVLMLLASLGAYVRSLQQVALMAALSALICGVFAIAYLGWLPVDGAAARRVQAHVA